MEEIKNEKAFSRKFNRSFLCINFYLFFLSEPLFVQKFSLIIKWCAIVTAFGATTYHIRNYWKNKKENDELASNIDTLTKELPKVQLDFDDFQYVIVRFVNPLDEEPFDEEEALLRKKIIKNFLDYILSIK